VSADNPGVVKNASRPRPGLRELFLESLWMGAVGFGGGMSVLAVIRSRAVDRFRWLTQREFDNAATVAQMLPGGAAANALAYVGLRFEGLAGAAVAYLAFCLPGFAAILALAWAYARFGTTAKLEVVLGGLNAAVVGVIASITVKMLSSSVGRLWQMGVAAGALLLTLAAPVSPLEIACLGILCGLVLDVLLKRARARSISRHGALPAAALPEEGGPIPPRSGAARMPAAVVALGLAGSAGAILGSRLFPLAAVFFRTGLGAYGGGFAIIPHLESVMSANHWITARQFADSVAMGKLTPGPVLLMATFIGFLVAGLPGSLVATAAILAGPFLLVVTLGTWLNRARSRLAVRAALRGLTPAVVGLMAASAITLGESLRGPVEHAIAAASALTLIRFRVNPVLVLVVGAVVRVAASFLA